VEEVAVVVDRKGQLTTWDAVRAYLFAGDARFTLRSAKTGARFTYRVKVKKRDVEGGLTGERLTYFVELLRGPDNGRDYRYMGVLRLPGLFNLTPASAGIGRDAAGFKALVWFLDKMTRGRDVLGKATADGVEFWHDGRCGRCGRELTVPESVARGLGPSCYELGPDCTI
jgi:hypothetical protein